MFRACGSVRLDADPICSPLCHGCFVTSDVTFKGDEIRPPLKPLMSVGRGLMTQTSENALISLRRISVYVGQGELPVRLPQSSGPSAPSPRIASEDSRLTSNSGGRNCAIVRAVVSMQLSAEAAGVGLVVAVVGWVCVAVFVAVGADVTVALHTAVADVGGVAFSARFAVVDSGGGFASAPAAANDLASVAAALAVTVEEVAGSHRGDGDGGGGGDAYVGVSSSSSLNFAAHGSC